MEAEYEVDYSLDEGNVPNELYLVVNATALGIQLQTLFPLQKRVSRRILMRAKQQRIYTLTFTTRRAHKEQS